MRKLVFTLLVILSLCSVGFAQSVIDPELHKLLNQKGDEKVSINIVLKSQMDFNKVRDRVEKVTDKKIRRNILIDELKLFTEKEQQEILSILKAEERSSKVSDISSRWMSNSINCMADRDVIYLLAEHPDVMMIGYDEVKYLLWDEKAEVANPEKGDMIENITKVNADDVWDLGFNGYGVVVAVIDTGVNYNHIDLADHLWDGGPEFPNHGYNTFYNNNDPMDLFGHGTHCAGTIAGDGTSGTKTGIAPEARIMCVKALDDEGGGSANSINEGMEWAIEHHADVLSLSLGIGLSTVPDRTLLRRTCVTALELGVVAAVACGNEGYNQLFYPIPDNVRVPGSCPPPWLHPDQANTNPGELSCVVSIGAVDYNDNVADFSSQGPVTWQHTEFGDYAYQPGIGLIRPDVCAPGVNIVSLDFATNDGHVKMSGTSMATPCVAGVMALMLEKNPNLTPADISMILETTAHKISSTKNNRTGSGRIDALAAIQAIETGDINYVSHFINDEEYGNANANLNPLEQVKLDVTFQNNSEISYTNVKAVLRSDNILVRIDDSIAQINSIGANETITITDEFEFLLDETAKYKSIMGFDVVFYDENDELISYFRVPVSVKGSELQYSSIIIKNDDNGNGILEAGETADFGVVINNIGNELAVDLTGFLSCDDNDITINTNEANFNSIGGDASAVAFFNVTLSNNVSDVFSIPFEITITDVINNESVLSFDYANACAVIFELIDTYSDGWDGAAVIVKYSDGTPDEAFTVTDGNSKIYTRQIGTGVEVTLEWMKGAWDYECVINITKENGDVIYYAEGPFSNGFLFSWTNDCSKANDNFEMCEEIQNLSATSNDYEVTLIWEAPENNTATSYEVYRDSRFLGTTEELSFVDEPTKDGIYIYSVRAIYEECSGLFSNISVDFVLDVNEHSYVTEANIYPNPSQNIFNIVCENMKRITVYDVMGSVIMDTQVNNNNYTISDLNAGVYFINIETNEGNVVKKVVKI